MKRILLSSFFLLFISCGVQNTPVNIGPISDTIEINEKQDELYIKANNWMVENFNSAKSVIQFSDKEAGIVTGKYLLKSTYNYSGFTATEFDIFAVIKIQVKDGATKITITPDNFNTVKSELIDQKYQYTEEIARNQINLLIDSYLDYVENDNSNDW
ncbi:DUF4468 domain-containing protein [Zunongwangia profunda]|uniref:DUF4468 domain-containing protein n=1 Tax=Zunongwangia profunda TaxID=398743 RepID=UPI0023A8926D|nr:DUF4468 domain-containing protein [Zunongwangia profunda]